MFSFRKQARPQPRVPDGCRVYAIGDVHGCLDLLTDLVGQIDRDDHSRTPARTSLVFVGDLVDRGPDPAGVVRFVRALTGEKRFRVRLIKGNHEELLLLAAAGDAKATRLLMNVGGETTVRSFGIGDEEAARGNYGDLAELLRVRLPGEDLAFLDRAEDLVEFGDYIFVHAGVRPGIPYNEQDVVDLRWIRREFLDSRRDHGKFVIHGHTPSDTIQERSNRMGIDTGAFATGRLSAVGLEEDRRWFLTAGTEAAVPALGREAVGRRD